ncbi:MAG: Indole-3-glycerol phosphate synthase [Alphaproteobacteria bacterium MarineAlpha2_Bin1]|nr:MAG: Indole-3-glycerol phosphate synthase [Alphaproteobacteria bacterium MarineAlpha2_Bin1]|tara:strand:- start:1013 stop:1801 length:789 start_codon:yes stop_codon:yes gene_type:complete
MKNILKDICNYKKIFVEQRKKILPLKNLEEKCKFKENTRGFHNTLIKSSEKKISLIAEVKKASPSAGLLFKDYQPVNIAKTYQKSGATCISILTDEKYFMGCNNDLIEVKENIKLPCLRKDFIVDPYQVYESKVIGADAILLIMAALEDNLAKEIEEIAIKLGLDILIEVHDEIELQRALNLKSKLIGINNRNLKTLQTNISTTKKLAPLIPKNYTIVSESGLKKNNDLIELFNFGISCFLIGESLLNSDNIAEATKKIIGS